MIDKKAAPLGAVFLRGVFHSECGCVLEKPVDR
jgi:hypothetical protein